MTSTPDDAYRTAAEPQRVQRFRLDPERIQRAQGKKYLWGLLIAFVIVSLTLVLWSTARPMATTFVPMAFMALAGILGLLRGGKFQPAQLAGYELLLAPRVLRRIYAPAVPAEILRPEVTRIVETKKGLWVTSDRPKRALFVTRALDGYDDARVALMAWRPIEPLAGFAAFAFHWRNAGSEAARGARAGTVLATDPALSDELEAVRAASGDRGAGLGAPVAVPRLRSGRTILILWAVLIVMFLAIWQFLGPPERPTPARSRAPQSHEAP